MGKSDILTYLVRGWRQANGVLWQINLTIKVTEACLNFQGESRFFREVGHDECGNDSNINA